jgi:hypothetical protein
MSTFDELSANRRILVDGVRLNNMAEGWRGLLSKLYPEDAHLIYELLQNAEDAGANEIMFQLESDRLVVDHDGSKTFNLADIDSITNIGDSTKAGDANSIGKFGVGFKSVFAYTSQPEIRSAEYSFMIQDLFIPVRIDGPAPEGRTRFTFPFNQPDKPPGQASEEIARGLRDIGANTLLFLTSIKALTYTLPDGSKGSLERKELGRDHVSIYHESNGLAVTSHWIRLIAECEIDDDESGAISATVAAAFQLEQVAPESKGKRAGKQPSAAAEGTVRLQIKPLDEGQVSIYFPAVKEISGLRFHVHAPFASTPARDSLAPNPGNDKLIGAIGELIADALPRLRDDGFLNDGLLAALPNAEDVLPKAYEVIRTSIFQAFVAEELVPTHGRAGFASTGDLLNSPPAFRKALSHTDLNFLATLEYDDRERPWRWIAQGDGRAGKFLNSLDIEDFGWEELNDAMNTVIYKSWRFDEDEHSEIQKKWLAWLSGKDDKDLRRLYLFLGEGAIHSDDTHMSFREIPLIRLYDKNKMRHVRGDEAYLPSSRVDTAVSRVPPILAVFPGDPQDDKEISLLSAFYERAGVKRWDASAKVQERLKEYQKGARPNPSSKRHLDDLRMFVKYVAENPSRGGEFRGIGFLATESNVEMAWSTPANTYIDNPYIDSGLSALFHGSLNSLGANRRNRLWMGYHSEVDGMLNFCKAIGCQTSLRIVDANVQHNPCVQSTWYVARASRHYLLRDWDIEHLEAAVETKNKSLLLGLWDLVAGASALYATAVMRWNKSSEEHTFPSQAAQKLETLAWVLDRDGNLRTPRASHESELADGMAKPVKHGLVAELGFGQNTILDELSQKELERQGASLGLKSIGVTQKVMALMEGMTEEEQITFLDEWASERRAHVFEGDPSANPDHRAELAGRDGAMADETKYETRERSVATRAPGQRDRVKEYLRQHCSGGDGHVVCQVCLQAMPFQVSGLDYFEAVEVVGRRKKDHHQNRLALCPLCAAKYQHARATDDVELLKSISTKLVDETTATVKIPVTLADEYTSITFSAKHFIDLQAVLKAAGEER